MTTPTTTVRATAPEPRPRFRDLLAAEWIKLWSLRSIRWTFALSAAALILFNTNGVLADYRNWPSYSPQLRASYPAAGYEDIFVPSAAMVLMLVTGSIGAITSIGHPGALRAVLASALLAPVCALIGVSIGAILRHTATTMVTTAALLLLVPAFLDERHRWTAAIAHAMPYLARQRLWRLDELGFPPGHPLPVDGHRGMDRTRRLAPGRGPRRHARRTPSRHVRGARVGACHRQRPGWCTRSAGWDQVFSLAWSSARGWPPVRLRAPGRARRAGR
ncbi:hypothetical protein [Kitasatospora sp. NPDC017646]|uniref:hypothetical protein n=1 Tax=Kitasatospora sp. NPDC017646 TaxID=3364024 RepID=UPI0037A0A582